MGLNVGILGSDSMADHLPVADDLSLIQFMGLVLPLCSFLLLEGLPSQTSKLWRMSVQSHSEKVSSFTIIKCGDRLACVINSLIKGLVITNQPKDTASLHSGLILRASCVVCPYDHENWIRRGAIA